MTNVTQGKSDKLYELTDAFLSALDNIEIDDETGEVLDMCGLEEIEARLEEKAEQVACFIKDREAFAESLKAEERRLKERRERIEKKAVWLKEYLSECLQGAGKDRVETARAVISFRQSESVYIADEFVIPDKYMVVKTERKPDKALIKKTIKEGTPVKGAELISKQNIQIK